MSRSFNIMIYWGGRIIIDHFGTNYEGGNRAIFRVKEDVRLTQLKVKVAEKMNLSSPTMISNLTFRMPVSTGGTIHYSHFEITDADGLGIMFATAKELSGLNCIEVYVECRSPTQGYVTMEQFSQPSWANPSQARVSMNPYNLPIEAGRSSFHFGSTSYEPHSASFGNIAGSSYEPGRASFHGFPGTSYGGVDMSYRGYDSNIQRASQGSEEVNYGLTGGNYYFGDDPSSNYGCSGPYNASGYVGPSSSHGNPGPSSSNPDVQTVNEINQDEDEDDDDDDTFECPSSDEDDEPPSSDAGSDDVDSEEEAQPTNQISVNEDDIYGTTSAWASEGQLHKGLVFSTKEEAVSAVKKFSLKQNRQYFVDESTTKLFVAVCRKKDGGCPWRCRVSKKMWSRKWEITKIEAEHTCLASEISADHPQMDSNFIAREIEESVKKDVKVRISVLAEFINGKYQFTPSYRKTWTAKEKAIAAIHGDWDSSYEKLPFYLGALKAANPGTITELQHLGNSHDGYSVIHTGVDTFRRLFWTFSACIEGFKFCRPILLIDGTFLYGRYKGTLLVASGVDGGDHILPVAFAIVEGESESSWAWFLTNVRTHVTRTRKVCIISDRHAGILKAVDENQIWPTGEAFHRYCLRHVGANVQKFSGMKTMAKHIYAIGTQYQERKFRAMITSLSNNYPEVATYMAAIPDEKWTATYDGGRRFGVMTTNIPECVNGILKDLRHVPITAIVSGSFKKVVKFFVTNRAEYTRDVAAGHQFPLKCRKILERRVRRAGFHHITTFNNQLGIYEVKTGYRAESGKGGNIQVVNIKKKACTCGKFQGTGIPCSHIMAACRVMSLNWVDWVTNWYRLYWCQKVYEKNHYPVPHEDYWPPYNGRPLQADVRMRRTVKGRPKSSRYKNEMDWRVDPKPTLCSVCHREGHNRRTCSRHVR